MKTTRHELPVANDAHTLRSESQLIEQANEVRAWYSAWNHAWDRAQGSGWVGPSGSLMWRDVTRIARQSQHDADADALLDWLSKYVGIEEWPWFQTPSNKAEEADF